jgi:hypothetical protein
MRAWKENEKKKKRALPLPFPSSLSFSRHATLPTPSPLTPHIHSKWPAEFKYEAGAAKGHLPLTNALRGTQLFEAILEHPAWETAPQGGGSGSGSGGKAGPDWL